MHIPIAVTLTVALMVIVLVVDARKTARRHLTFGKDDVLEALDNVLSEEIVPHDKWDMFLERPVADTYLESVRQRCLDICRHDQPEARSDLSELGAAKVDAIRREVREAPNRSLQPTPSARLTQGVRLQ